MSAVLQVNFALWGMIICGGIKVAQFLGYF